MSTIRGREAAVQDSENSVYKMHEKDSEDSVHKMHEKNSETSENSTTSREGRRWKIGDGRWEAGLGRMAKKAPPELGVDSACRRRKTRLFRCSDIAGTVAVITESDH